MRLQEMQGSMKHDISMEANRVVMLHIHGLHKRSTASLPMEEVKQSYENNFEHRSMLMMRHQLQYAT
jgi:hypothetical protein